MRITLPDGREFPTLDGKTALSWSLGLHNTFAQQALGYPEFKAVLCELDDERLYKEYRDWLKGTFDPIFGQNGKHGLAMIETEIAIRREREQ